MEWQYVAAIVAAFLTVVNGVWVARIQARTQARIQANTTELDRLKFVQSENDKILDRLKAEVERLTKQVEALEASKAQLVAQVEEQRKQKHDLSNRCQEIQAEKDLARYEHEHELRELQTEHERALGELRTRNAVLEAKAKDMADCQQQIQILTSRVRELEGRP